MSRFFSSASSSCGNGTGIRKGAISATPVRSERVRMR
jgi:hypothetical protein